MSRDLPGYYFDAVENRYVLINGPTPGTSSSTSAAQQPPSMPIQPSNSCGNRARITKLLQNRELNGNVLSLAKGKCNFEVEFQKRLASQPVVWKYQGADSLGEGAFEQIRVSVITAEGQYETDVLLAGTWIGSLSFLEVGRVRQDFYNGVKCIPDQVWPLIKGERTKSCKVPDLIWRPDGVQMTSVVSSIKLFDSPCTIDAGFNCRQHVLITTSGTDASCASLCVLNVVDPIDFDFGVAITRQNMREVASLNCNIWTADCNANTGEAVIGTNLGVAVVNLETGKQSWVCRSKSDVLAQQLLPSGNAVLCGLRNGAIVTVDVREKPVQLSSGPIRHRLFYTPLHRTRQITNKQWFELTGNVYPTNTVLMPSCISSLVSLHHYDQYFLASSMDGSIKLYDQRLVKKGPVQSYDGHVNSHSMIQLGVDPSEKFVMSGGEDCNLRVWSIMSGELLFEERFCNATPYDICWKKRERYAEIVEELDTDEEETTEEEEEEETTEEEEKIRVQGEIQGEEQSNADFQFEESYGSDTWIRTGGGLFRMHWDF